MNEMVKRTWTALDGQLIFDITINRNPRDATPSVVEIHCKRGPESRAQIVTVQDSRPTEFNVSFMCGCYAYGYFQQQTGININGVENTGIFADMHFGVRGLYDNTHFEGLMVVCPSRPGPTGPALGPGAPGGASIPADQDPSDPGSPIPIISSQPGELFTYVYVRRWPKVSAEELAYAFIEYQPHGASASPPASPPAGSFYEGLVAASHVGRRAAEALALAFVDGRVYPGVFVSSVSELSGPARDFATIADRARRSAPDADGWLEQLVEQLAGLLARDHQTAAELDSAGYRGDIDRIWQTYFALVVLLGYDEALLLDCVETLWLAHLIARATTTTSAGQLAVVDDLSAAQIIELANATIILPETIFPLPPAQPGRRSSGRTPSPPFAARGQRGRGRAAHATASAGAPKESGWIEPYAIGDLQLVRQRLVRYAAGEIARVENVMRGERRESSRRHTQRQIELREQRSSEDQVIESADSDERSDLLEESRRTLAERSATNAYDSFQTSYGPPTQATLDGSWTRTEAGVTPELEDLTRFAREILNKTVNRINRKVGMVRASSTMNQVEEVVTSVVDNSAGETNLCAVFRWLEKVYEAYVVNYGNRLMIEFLVRHPAARVIAREAALTGRRLVRPPALAELGVLSFEDIDPNNYAQLCARYGVTEIEPPPLAHKLVTATLRAGESEQIAVPTGYCTVDALVSCVMTPPSHPPPAIVVGLQVFDSGETQTPLKAYGDDSTIPVSVASLEPSLSPPVDAQALVNVEVGCEPTQRAMDQWRIATYAALDKAYREQADRDFDEAGRGGGSSSSARSPLANRKLEQRELEDACVRLLLERGLALTGARDDSSASPPTVFAVDEPRYWQFLELAFEWTEMAYSFQVDPRLDRRQPGGLARAPAGEATGEDELFTRFLQAEQARILVPVRPDRVMAFLYYFCTGMIWTGGDRTVPTIADDVPLVNDIKHRLLAKEPERSVGPSWEVVVPTSMQILDDRATALPGLLTKARQP